MHHYRHLHHPNEKALCKRSGGTVPNSEQCMNCRLAPVRHAAVLGKLAGLSSCRSQRLANMHTCFTARALPSHAAC